MKPSFSANLEYQSDSFAPYAFDPENAVAFIAKSRASGVIAVTPDGEVTAYEKLKEDFFTGGCFLTLRAGFTLSRSGIDSHFRAPEIFDLAELYLFLQPCAPSALSVRAYCEMLNLPPPRSDTENCFSLYAILKELEKICMNASHADKKNYIARSAVAGAAGWNWADFILQACGMRDGAALPSKYTALAVWEKVRNREKIDRSERVIKPNIPISPAESSAFLKHFLGKRAETRESQTLFSETVAKIFSSENPLEAPVILCEAETGTGKTAGYLAPALLWSFQNPDRAVILSTHTKALQRQILRELRRFLPDEEIFDKAVAIRKGRDNYICLRNFKDYTLFNNPHPADRIAAAFLAGYILKTDDGDFIGGDFFNRLSEILPSAALTAVTDKARDCTRAACDFYQKCFVEKAEDKSKQAKIIIANHAALIARALTDDIDERAGHYIFDEAHHLFDIADSAFTVEMNVFSLADLRKRIAGAAKSRRSSGRSAPSVSVRLSEAIIGVNDEKFSHDLLFLSENYELSARALPDLSSFDPDDQNDPFAVFFKELKQYAKENPEFSNGQAYGYEQAIYAHDHFPANLIKIAKEIGEIFTDTLTAERALIDSLAEKAQNADLQPGLKKRLLYFIRSIERNASAKLTIFRQLTDLFYKQNPENEKYVYLLKISTGGSREEQATLIRRSLNPAPEFATRLLHKIDGAAFASAGLRADMNEQSEKIDSFASLRTGAAYLERPLLFRHFSSPFNYAKQARIFILTDLKKNEDEKFFEAIFQLTLASEGGALALFTAVRRLLACRSRIGSRLFENGIPVFCPHADAGDQAAPADIFRETPNALLMGSDALRDGTDVPGDGLRLVIADKVPWPRPDAIHIARREIFGGREYDKILARTRLKQAFGRLIRQKDDRGCFVLASSECPSELLTAFPKEAIITRCDTAQAAREIKAFLAR